MTKTEYLKDSYKLRLYVVAAINVALFWVVVIFRADFSMIWTLLSSISLPRRHRRGNHANRRLRP